MTAPIRIATLSFAHYHAVFWSEVFRDSPQAEFVGIWDEDAVRGRKAAETYRTKYWDDLDALLAACDAVAVCSETLAHRSLIERAAKHGCHVLCEKPPATTLEDCDAIAGAVSQAGVTFMQSFPKRFDPVNHELRDLLAREALGKIWLVRVRHGHFHGLEPHFKHEWFVDAAKGGGGTLLDEGIHGTDFLRWMFGEPETVSTTISGTALGLPVEDTAIAVFRYANGLIAELVCGWSFAAADNSIEIYGLKGSAVLSGVDLASRDITQGGYLRTFLGGERRWTVSPTVPRFKSGGFHQQNALAFLDSLARKVPPPIGLEDGRRALELVLCAYEAARSGIVQRIPPPRQA
ncbi:MAG: Gfo/Idh/MocA family oxidoreductase [Proteobacteria bacterium]|nr:Gfo/Idh/MocA family oxidoreductase [Pseudomonadota bacterium]